MLPVAHPSEVRDFLAKLTGNKKILGEYFALHMSLGRVLDASDGSHDDVCARFVVSHHTNRDYTVVISTTKQNGITLDIYPYTIIDRQDLEIPLVGYAAARGPGSPMKVIDYRSPDAREPGHPAWTIIHEFVGFLLDQRVRLEIEGLDIRI